jgi:predicted DNA-binding antitoxin AbrB/MazE fold protein
MSSIEAVFEHGYLKPLVRLPLAEHQHVWVTILTDELSARQLAELAARSPSFQFLAAPEEDLYSPDDGQPV